jgi:hypothetical protein
VSARSVDALVSAMVDATVEQNWFGNRATGVEARTQYDTMTHDVALTVRNNVFNGVANPVTLSEGGLVGRITAHVDFNTFYSFDRGILLLDVDRAIPGLTSTRGNLFAIGNTGIDATNSPFEAIYTLMDRVTTLSMPNPLGAAIATGSAGFVDGPGGDFRLGAASEARDKIPTTVSLPTEDFAGCSRPNGPGDIGAFEAR